MGNSSREINEYQRDLTDAFLKSDIPLFKVSEKAMKSFLEKYTGRKTPSHTSLHNCVDTLYEETLTKIRDQLKDNHFYFILDETTDVCGRYVLNILVGVLNGEKVKSMLLSVRYLSKCDANSIGQEIVESCRLIWPQRTQYDKVLLIVTDQAANMKAAIRGIKGLFVNMSHVTRIA
jgi:hypothetical protein